MKHRDIIFDLLRTISLISALGIHYHIKVYLGPLINIFAFPVKFFTIGGLFFFISGYMLKKVYWPRFCNDPLTCSKYLFKKGVKICLLYLFYIFCMYILTNSPIPMNVWSFLLMHHFFAKVLLTFGILYVIFPFFLVLYSISVLFLFFLFLIFVLIIYVGISFAPVEYNLAVFLIKKQIFGYPIIPSLFIAICGFFCAKYYPKSYKSKYLLIFCFLILFFHLFLLSFVPPYYRFMTNSQIFTFFEPLFVFVFYIFLNHFVDFFKKIFKNFDLFLIGRESLAFFVLFNMFISLCQITPNSSKIARLLGLIVIFFLSWLFTVYYSKYKIKRSVNLFF